VKPWRSTLLLVGLWVNAYAAGFHRAEGMTWQALALIVASATYLVALVNMCLRESAGKSK